jgi:hypothetical protein
VSEAVKKLLVDARAAPGGKCATSHTDPDRVSLDGRNGGIGSGGGSPGNLRSTVRGRHGMSTGTHRLIMVGAIALALVALSSVRTTAG